MSNNIWSPLIDTLWNVPKAFYSLTHKLPKYIKYIPTNEYRAGNNLYLPIGITNKGKELNLVLDNSNHACLIAGVSGSGKSNCLHTIINALLSYNCELFLLDHKVTELGQYALLRQCKCYEYEAEAIEEALSNILNSIREEYKQLLAKGKTHSNPYSTVKVLIVEELSIATKKALSLLAQIACICRACNWRIICTIQRGDGTIMNSQLKALLTNRICFKQVDKANSELVIYNDKASTISIVGRGYYLRDSKLLEFQAYYMTLETINKTIKRNSKIITEEANTEIENINDNWIEKL